MLFVGFGQLSDPSPSKDETKLTCGCHGQKDRKGDDGPTPLVDDPNSIDLHPITHQPNEENQAREVSSAPSNHHQQSY